MNWLHYLAEANLYLAVFYLAYCLLLSRETHYQLNRTYLLFSCIAAFALPVLQIGTLKIKAQAIEKPVVYAMPAQAVPEAPMQMRLQTVNDYRQPAYAAQPKASATPPAAPVVKQQLSLADYLWYAYLTGSAVLLVMLIVRLTSLLLLMRGTVSVKHGRYKIVQLPCTNIAFSFFNYLFLGDNAPATDTIITHELVHIRQKHSVDVIFLELLKIVNWFNPFVYLLQNSLKTVHEYIADEHTAAHEKDAYTYASFLVSTAHGVGGSPITHSFFNYNLLKKRITMLNQKRSGKSARLKYLVTAPICAALLCASTLAFTKNYNLVDLDPGAVATADKLFHKFLRVKSAQNPVTAIESTRSERDDNATLIKKSEIKPANERNSTAVPTGDEIIYKPFVSNGGYYALAHYLHKTINYKPTPDDKGGAVVIGFTLDKDLRMADLKIVKSAGEKLDNMAMDAFKNYKGTVNDDPGRYLEFTVYYLTTDYEIFKSTRPANGSAEGAILVTKEPYKFNVTSKGYEYDENPKMGPLDGHLASAVWIYLKDGSYEYYRQDMLTDSQAALLKNKYGYNYPSNAYPAMAFLPAVNGNKSKYSWTVMDINSYLKEPYTKAFYKHIYDTLQFPANEKANLKTAVVLVKFNLNQSGVINNVGVAKSGGADFDKAAVEAVKSFNGSINDNEGEHTVAIVFCLAVTGSRPVVSDSFKNDGYIGEVAHAERKSAFDNIFQKPADTDKK